MMTVLAVAAAGALAGSLIALFVLSQLRNPW